MLEYIYYAISACVCTATVAGIVMRCRFRSRTDVVYSTGSFWFTAVSSLLVGGAMFALTVMGWAAAAWPFALLALFALLAWGSWLSGYIVYDDTGFTLRKWLFFEKRYQFGEVSGLRTEERKRRSKVVDVTVYLHIYGDRIVLDPQAKNYDRFLEAMEARYRAAHGTGVPALKR